MSNDQELEAEILEAVSGNGGASVASNDVTSYLLTNCSGPGDYVRRVHEAKPAKSLTPTLKKLLDELRSDRDPTVGATSNALAYGRFITGYGKKSRHRDIIRLIKGGFVRVVRIDRPPAPGTSAHGDAPYGNWYYRLEVV